MGLVNFYFNTKLVVPASGGGVKVFQYFKGTVDEISSDSQFVRFTTVPIKHLHGQEKTRYPCFFSLKLVIFYSGFSINVTGKITISTTLLKGL